MAIWDLRLGCSGQAQQERRRRSSATKKAKSSSEHKARVDTGEFLQGYMMVSGEEARREDDVRHRDQEQINLEGI